MHEFSLAASIVEIVTTEVEKAGKQKATSITLQIGDISGVEKNALYTALDSLLVTNTLKGAKIITETTEGIAKCAECGTEFKLNDMFDACPKCQSYFKDVISGKEFNVLSIEAE